MPNPELQLFAITGSENNDDKEMKNQKNILRIQVSHLKAV